MILRKNDIFRAKQRCICGSNQWMVLETGDIMKIRCTSCEKEVFIKKESLEEHAIDAYKNDLQSNPNEINQDASTLKCPFDDSKLVYGGMIKKLGIKRKQYENVYNCPYCKRKFINNASSQNVKYISYKGVKYININSKDIIKGSRKSSLVKNILINTLPFDTHGCVIINRIPQKCLRPKCKYSLVNKHTSYLINGKLNTTTFRYCPLCGLQYLRRDIYEHLNHNWYYEVTLENDGSLIVNQRAERHIQSINENSEILTEARSINENTGNLRRSSSEQLKESNLYYVSKKSYLSINTCNNCRSNRIGKTFLEYQNKNGTTVQLYVKFCLKCGAYLIPKKLYESYPEFFEGKTVVNSIDYDSSIDEENNKDLRNKQDTAISIHDFVVRSNLFHCMHKDHKLENINAIVSIINKKGEVIEKRIPAGYCSVCNTFFIMDSTFQSIKSSGVMLCRITDEDSYLNQSIIRDGMKLAKESILMQFGYSVSQTKELTVAQRQKILSEIVDYEILTPSEIVSYLDFFINQRKSQSKYEIAISKWVKDKQFISSYGYEDARSVKVRSIKTKH